MSNTMSEWSKETAKDEGVEDYDADNQVGDFLPDEDVVDESDLEDETDGMEDED